MEKYAAPPAVKFGLTGPLNALLHGDTLSAYQRMGSPRYPSAAQVHELNAIAERNSAETLRLSADSIKLEIPVDGLLLLELPTK